MPVRAEERMKDFLRNSSSNTDRFTEYTCSKPRIDCAKSCSKPITSLRKFTCCIVFTDMHYKVILSYIPVYDNI